MVETMRAAAGLGLAAPQVALALRLIVVLPLADRGQAPETVEPLVICNPRWEPIVDRMEDGIEGCLSIPGLRGVVPRCPKILWSGADPDGRPIGGEAEHLFARVLQHEVDHLDGVLYPERMSDLRLLATADQTDHLLAELERRKDVA